jgi:predicted small metal-binding protein
MKMLTCAQMGGPCDAELKGNTPKELLDMGMEHVKAMHPEMIDNMKNMTKEQNDAWNADFEKKWEAAPETM